MQIPETQKTNDALDFLADACQVLEEVETDDGRVEKVLVLDPRKVWHKTQSVNSSTYGRCALELENFKSLGKQCFNFMSKKRAVVMSRQIEDKAKSYEYSIDAKSSESIRDKHNAQTTLLDKMLRNKQERIVTLKDEAKNSIARGLGLSKDDDGSN